MARRFPHDQQLGLWTEGSPSTGPVRIGTSGWHYKHWRGPFYPAAMQAPAMLRYFAQQFDCVELNNSFYRLPSKQAFARWRDATPEGFAFAVKASRFMTHVKRLATPKETIGRLTSAAAGLGAKRGPVLFQLPPTWGVDVARLRAFLRAWPREWPSAWEFRNDDWFRDEVYDVLAEHGAGLCLHDLDGRRVPEVLTADLVYVRLHGPDRAYAGSYPDALLGAWARKLAAWTGEGYSPWVFFNNDAEGHAPHDAARLRAMVRGELGLEAAA
jgi:uncharacterized protein YecE (DUF72 family)